jgi:hypothetical protein
VIAGALQQQPMDKQPAPLETLRARYVINAAGNGILKASRRPPATNIELASAQGRHHFGARIKFNKARLNASLFEIALGLSNEEAAITHRIDNANGDFISCKTGRRCNS